MDIKPVPKTNDHNKSPARERANFHDKGKKKSPDPAKPPSQSEASTGEVSSAPSEAINSQIVDSEKVLELLATTPTNAHSKAEFVKIAGKVSLSDKDAPASAKKLNKTL